MLLAAAAAPGLGQDLALKRPAPGAEPIGAACVSPAGPPAPPGRRAAADSLLAAGTEAAILGDQAAARDLLRRAAALDATDPVIAYRLARTLEDGGDVAAAKAEYCRYLALAPGAEDVPEVHQRLRELSRREPPDPAVAFAAEVASGTAAFDDGRYVDAVEAFTRAIALAPDRPEAYFNRAVAQVALGRREAAAGDLEAYLERAPDAADRSEVQAFLGAGDPAPAAASPPPSVAPPPADAPGQVLLKGLALPGFGQYATGRTVLGLGVLAGVGGAVHYAYRPRTVVRTRAAVDPFGNPYEYEVRSLERPHRTPGLLAAAGIAGAAALEAYLFARRARTRSGVDLVPGATADAAPGGLRLSVSAGEGRVGIGVVVPARARRGAAAR